MNKTQFVAKLDYFGAVHGVTIRAVAAFDDAELDFRPEAAVRTPKELIFHIYTQERTLAEAARRGSFPPEEANRANPEDEAAGREVRALATTAAVKAYAEDCHRAADGMLRSLSDDDLARPVESPFGTLPAWRFFDFAYDEHWHHRGQLYTYLRLLGKEPPMLYDY